MNKYELLKDTSDIQIVSWEEFAEAIFEDNIRRYNNHEVETHDEYLALSSPQPPFFQGIHYTLILPREACYEDNKPMGEILSILLQNDVIPLIKKHYYYLGMENFREHIEGINLKKVVKFDE